MKKILVLEDESDLLEVICELITDAEPDAQIDAVDSVEKAMVEIMSKPAYDYIVLDDKIKKSRLRGAKLADMLVTTERSTKIIVFTGTEVDTDAELILKADLKGLISTITRRHAA